MGDVNTYKAIGFLITFLPEPVGDYMKAAQEHLRDIADAYNALAPEWAQAPEWAKWYVADTAGLAAWYEKEPTFASDGWQVLGVTNVSYCESVDLPLGIDWRLCKWSREGAK